MESSASLARGLRKIAVAQIAGPLLVVTACGAGGQSCSEVGLTNSVSVSIDEALFLVTGELDVTVCQEDSCAEKTFPLGELRQSVERSVTFEMGPDDVALQPGVAVVTAELRDSRYRIVASFEDRQVDLRSSYPNGAECDDRPSVSGTVAMAPSDESNA